MWTTLSPWFSPSDESVGRGMDVATANPRDFERVPGFNGGSCLRCGRYVFATSGLCGDRHRPVGGEVDQYAFMLTNVSTSWVCQGGFNFAGGFAALQGSAGNYSGKVAKATLKIVRNG
jgi:hypothetical protein